MLNIFLFIIFLFINIVILMQIYKVSTYHKYFLPMMFVLIGYGGLISYLMIVLNFSNGFFWLVFVTIIVLIDNFKKTKKQSQKYISTAENKEQRDFITKSTENTIKFYLLSSLAYVASLICVFVYLYNI